MLRLGSNCCNVENRLFTFGLSLTFKNKELMKTVVFILSTFLVFFTAQAQEESVTVKVTIENVLNDDGVIVASLHSTETFMKGAGLIDLVQEAQKGVVTLTFENVEPGIYAIMVLHDQNENNRMDFEPNGMPKESYGMSGNAMAMGPPTFNDAKFEVTNEDLEFKIRF